MSELTKWEQLEAPFPFSEIEVKVQTLKNDGTKALAIAYFDARAVRRRLNSVLGRGNWKAEYKHSAEGVICRLSVFIDEWHSMEDGADYTDIAKFKGGVSDAFKRAFAALCNDSLYSTDLGWQPCETYDGGNGKKKFSKWTDAAWKAMEELYTKQVCPKPKKNTKEPVPAKPRKGVADTSAPFGWKLDLLEPGDWQTSMATDQQYTYYKELLARHGIIVDSAAFRSWVVRAYGYDAAIVNKKGGYSLILEFLNDAPDSSIIEAVEAVEKALADKQKPLEGDSLAEKVKEVFAGATNGK
jgi:hypothetical protein